MKHRGNLRFSPVFHFKTGSVQTGSVQAGPVQAGPVQAGSVQDNPVTTALLSFHVTDIFCVSGCSNRNCENWNDKLLFVIDFFFKWSCSKILVYNYAWQLL